MQNMQFLFAVIFYVLEEILSNLVFVFQERNILSFVFYFISDNSVEKT